MRWTKRFHLMKSAMNRKISFNEIFQFIAWLSKLMKALTKCFCHPFENLSQKVWVMFHIPPTIWDVKNMNAKIFLLLFLLRTQYIHTTSLAEDIAEFLHWMDDYQICIARQVNANWDIQGLSIHSYIFVQFVLRANPRAQVYTSRHAAASHWKAFI